MRTRLLHTAAGVATVVLAAGVLASVTTGPAAAADQSWRPALQTGSGVGVAVVGGVARIDPRKAFPAPPSRGAEGAVDTAVPTGLLTFPARALTTATDRIATAVSTGRTGSGAGSATVDVRGIRASGNWSEWIPADGGTAQLPERSREVQARLVLTGDPGPVVTGVTLTATMPSAAEGARAEGAPQTFRVFATREGLVGGTTANGHVITENDRFVALPSRRALSPGETSDYSVRVCAANGRCAFAPVWDVGPWNTRDDYWSADREQWGDLPRGTPQAQAAFRTGYNGGKDQFGREVANPAGIDLGDGTFWDDLGLIDNSTVTVDYLWTGGTRLARVATTGPVSAAPMDDAPVVGIAAGDAGVPVHCTVGDWLRIGVAEYLPAAAVPDPGPLAPCTTGESSSTAAG